MRYTTTCGKTVTCPKWNITVTLRGKYRFTEKENPYEAVFVNATCPIIENSKISPEKQEGTFFLMRCPEILGCHFLSEFKPVIDVSKEGYSQ